MQANEMRLAFHELREGATAVDIGFDDNEVSKFLTMAQQLELEVRLFGNRNPYFEGFEVGAKRDAEFSELKKYCYIYNSTANSKIVTESGTTNATLWKAGLLPNSTVIELPTDFMYFSRDSVDIEYDGANYDGIRVVNTNEDNIDYILDNTFTKPDRHTIYRLITNRLETGRTTWASRSSRRCLLLTDANTTIRRYNLTYLRRPQDIIVDIITTASQRHCELDESFHLGIVRRAVQIALGSIASEKYQIAYTEKTINE